jgi:hypothetical protein
MTAPEAWRAISPVSSVSWWRPHINVFLTGFTVNFLFFVLLEFSVLKNKKTAHAVFRRINKG